MSNKVFLIYAFCAILLFATKSGAQTISTGQVNGAITACVGTASFDPNIQQFLVTGNGLSADISVTAPTNFEIATSASGPYAGNLNLIRTGGNVNAAIFVRSSLSAPVGNIAGNVSLTSAGAAT